MKLGIAGEKPFSLLESILWTAEDGFFLLDQHLDRLEKAAAYWGFSFSRPVTYHFLQQLTAGLKQPHKLRLTVDLAGNPAGEALPLIVDDRPVRVALAEDPINPADPFLYHKTTNRHVYERALASRPDVDDVILWNPKGEITESTIANVVICLNGTFYTPPVSCGLLPGTFRAHLQSQNVIQEKVVTVAAFQGAEEIFLINSVRKWRQCRVIDK